VCVVSAYATSDIAVVPYHFSTIWITFVTVTVSSAAICQTSCNTSTQLSAQLRHVSSVATCQLRNLSCQLLLVGWAVVCQLSCNLSTQLSAQLQHVSSAAPCQLRWNLSSKLYHVGWAVQIWRFQRGSVFKCRTQEFQAVVLILTYSTSAEPAARSSPENIYCESKVRGVPLRGYYRALGTSLSPILCLQIHFDLFWPNFYCVAQAIGFCANWWHLLSMSFI